MALAPSNLQTVGDAPLQWSLGEPGNPMYFDAWLRLNHNTGLTITQHPVETGAAITDHSYFNPRRYSFDIGMTDTRVWPEYPGQANRSVNAYNKLVDLQRTRTRLILVSKYGAFTNVLIESIDVGDDFTTIYAMRATISLVEILVANTQTTKVSADPQVTDQTNRGQLNPQMVEGRWYDTLRQRFPWLPALPGA